MIVVAPIEVTPSNLTSSVAITETVWTPGTRTKGQRFYEGTDLYEVSADSTTDQPSVGAAKEVPTWFIVGKINRFKMFDFSIGDGTVDASPIQVTVDPGGLVNAVALFEISGGATVRVRADDPVDGIVYDRTIALVDDSIVTNWYEYFFEPITQLTEVLFLDLPSYPSADIIVTVTGPGTVGIGECILGRQRTLGVTTQDVTVSIEDFSRKEQDEFGVFRVVERRFARLMNATVFVPSTNQNTVLRRLAEIRATPSVFIGGENFLETYVLGFYRDFTIGRTGPDTAEMRIEIEGLV